MFMCTGLYWHKTENRRNFFERYAEQHQFDPLVPQNWYNISEDDINMNHV